MSAARGGIVVGVLVAAVVVVRIATSEHPVMGGGAYLEKITRDAESVRFVVRLGQLEAVSVEPSCECVTAVVVEREIRGTVDCSAVESWVTPGVIIRLVGGRIVFVATPCE